MSSSVLLLSAFALGASVAAGPDDDAKCSMTAAGAGSGLYNIEMHSVHPIPPYKMIHCRFQSTDTVLSYKGSDRSGQCDGCQKSSDESITCGCSCPAGGSNCTYHFHGTVQYDPKHWQKNSTHAASCTCNTDPPGPPPPPTPPPPPPKPPPPKPPPKVCKAKLDIVVVLDGSASITTSDWDSVRSFTVDIVQAFNVSVEQAEIGAVQFSGSPFPIFGRKAAHTIIGLSSDAAAITSAVSKETQMNEDTNTYAGLHLAKTILDTSGRADAKGKLVILLTDGEQNQGKPAIEAAQALKQENVEIFGIGVGDKISKATMDTWVSSPAAKHYFPVTAFSELEKVLQQIVKNACPHPPV